MKEEFEVGDVVRVTTKCMGCIPGKNYKIYKHYDGILRARDEKMKDSNESGCRCKNAWIKIETKTKQEVTEMKDCIVKAYPVTDEAVLIEKWSNELGIIDNFICAMVIKDHSDDILAEAKRLEEESKKEKKEK